MARPRLTHLRRGPNGEQVALTTAGRGGHDAHAQSADHRRGHPGQDVARPEVKDPSGTSIGQFGDRLDPVDRLHQDGVGQFAGKPDIESDRACPPSDNVHPVSQLRRVEADLDRHRVEHG